MDNKEMNFDPMTGEPINHTRNNNLERAAKITSIVIGAILVCYVAYLFVGTPTGYTDASYSATKKAYTIMKKYNKGDLTNTEAQKEMKTVSNELDKLAKTENTDKVKRAASEVSFAYYCLLPDVFNTNTTTPQEMESRLKQLL